MVDRTTNLAICNISRDKLNEVKNLTLNNLWQGDEKLEP